MNPLNCLDLAVSKTYSNKPVVTYEHGPSTYKHGPSVKQPTLHLTQTKHIQNYSKTPTLRIIKFSSSFHTLNISPPHHMLTTWSVKQLLNTTMMWYKKQTNKPVWQGEICNSIGPLFWEWKKHNGTKTFLFMKWINITER